MNPKEHEGTRRNTEIDPPLCGSAEEISFGMNGAVGRKGWDARRMERSKS